MTKEEYIQLIYEALKKSFEYKSKLCDDIFAIDGMSGKMTRCFYNNLCSMDNARYLEIGAYKGSTFCSAMYNNPHGSYLAIDNFSEFGGPRQEFMDNLEKYKCGKVEFLESDCFSIDLSTISEKFNIFVYDGYHSYEAHYKVLNHFMSVLDDVFIFIVDDYNWPLVREASQKSIIDNNFTVLYEYINRTLDDGQDEVRDVMNSTFWNGMYVALLSKPHNNVIVDTSEK